MRNARCRAALIFALMAAAPISSHAACHPAPHSNLGCDFYAVTLPNAFADKSTYAFSVRALNPSPSTAANLQISGGGLVGTDSHLLAAGAAAEYVLPWVSAVSDATGTVLVAGAAYHLLSDLPVSVVQFNANAGAAQSNDATLLMPVQNAGTSFRANAWPEWSFNGQNQPSQVGIVATAASTTVQITGQNLQPGAGLTSTGGSVPMNAGDVLLLSSALTADADISGMQIAATAPVVVFSAHAGTYVPSTFFAGDHLEDAQPALSELGQDYLLVRPSDPTGGNGARQYLQVMGTVDGTMVTFDPLPAGAPGTLNAGQSALVETTSDVHASADHPIAITQYMESASAFAGNANYLGDPSQLTSIPTNYGALTMDFLAPSALAPIFAQVIAPTGAQVLIDGAPASGWQAIGSSGYSGANVPLCCSDTHHAEASQPFTLSVYAYPSAGTTSFWYAGGLGPSDDIFGDGFD